MFGRRFVANDLYHYGVKGMKWGVRRTPEQLGRPKNKVDSSGKSGKMRHEGFAKQVASQGPIQLAKSIRSLEKQISNHEDKLRNPIKYQPNWNSFSQDRQNNELNHWATEIRNFTEQIEIINKVKKGW